MKFVLYRFPCVLKWNKDEEEVYLPKRVKFPVQPELVAVEYSDDIYSVVDALIDRVVDELSCTEEYKGYRFTANLEENIEVLSLYTNKKFNYHLLGIVEPVYGKGNLLVDFCVIESEGSE